MKTAEYTVVLAFIDIDGIAKQPGWKVQLPIWRALVLYRAGFIAGPVYQAAPGGPWQAIGGTSRRVTSREENVAGLESAILLANELRLRVNASYADAADHTTAKDTVNVITGPQTGSLPTLLTLVAEMLASYDAHDTDAEKAANWVFHKAKEAGDHSLASAVAPADLQTAITRLNDLKAKFNAHDADATCHGVGSNHQVGSGNAAYGPVVRVPIRGAEPNDLIAWSVLDSGTGTVVGVRATAGYGYVDFEFDADPQNDCVISYAVTRALP